MKFRVWHIPQVPMKSFQVEVASVEEGVRMMNALADYDLFQYENNIKPDYCNMNGLQMWDESLTEEDMAGMELTDKWVDWYSDEYEDPREYVESQNRTDNLEAHHIVKG
ncbi:MULTISPECIES: superinfection exclusion protein [Yersinia]|uniref:superinfection exclusion protein n=1 Tax=Yersinia TaxID=629 RepID=UPI0011A2FA73|nr:MULTISPECIES: superinfection exclusion protein [Yersinia]